MKIYRCWRLTGCLFECFVLFNYRKEARGLVLCVCVCVCVCLSVCLSVCVSVCLSGCCAWSNNSSNLPWECVTSGRVSPSWTTNTHFSTCVRLHVWSHSTERLPKKWSIYLQLIFSKPPIVSSVKCLFWTSPTPRYSDLTGSIHTYTTMYQYIVWNRESAPLLI